MKEFRFLEWDVYKRAKECLKEIFIISSKFPDVHKFGLMSQINRAAVSMVLNIAEGSGKNSDKELSRFFDISLGSIYEVISCLDIARDNKLVSAKDFDTIVEQLKIVARQLGGFKRKIRFDKKIKNSTLCL